MELLRRQFLHIATTAAVLPTVLGMARGETNVSRPLHLIVGFAAGSSVDIIARLTAEQITKAQGLTIIVENQPGAGTILATEAGSRAAPDGNTLLIISPPFVINPPLTKTELQSANQLRAHLRPLAYANAHRRQQGIALSYARRSARRCKCKAGRLVAGKHRPGNHDPHRVRSAQARSQR